MEVISFCKALNLVAVPNKQKKAFVISCKARKHEAGDLYKILHLSPKNATVDDIKRAYRSMALKYHPDVCHDGSKKEESTRTFVEVNTAYKTLSNPRLRAEYDYELELRNRLSVGNDSWKRRWQEQVAELKIRSDRRMAQKEGSWSSRMRAHNIK